jgi:hypothetical protein
MPKEYDVFLSHAWADGDRPQRIAKALEKAGLRVWFDATELEDFAGITRAIAEGLANSKALVAYYSKTYPSRRACRWELTAAFLAAQAEGGRQSRILVINPEETDGHIHPIELRDAKYRLAPDDDKGLEELARAVAEHVAELKGLLGDIHPLNAPVWYGNTPVGSTRFVGRFAEMWKVHSLLYAGEATQITGAAAASGRAGQVRGLGGVGKSMLAEEYALQFGAGYQGGVFWLRAYGNDDAKSALGAEGREAERAGQVRSIAERLGVRVQEMTQEQIEGELARKIEAGGKPCLWIVDDVPNGLAVETLRRWFAPHPLARTLLTTRSREYASLANGINLSVLAPDEAYELLTSRRTPGDSGEKEQARLLAADLGYHALALDVTASALENSVAPAPFADFRAKLARAERDELELATKLADALPTGHEKSIAHTMMRSMDALGMEGQDFLRLASVLAVAPIPVSLAAAVFARADNLSPEEAQVRAGLALQQVASASLAESAGQNNEARAVHTLVSRTMRFRERGVPERTEALRKAAIQALSAEIAKAAQDPRQHRQIELHVVHARTVAPAPTNLDEATLRSWVARYDYVRGAYASARKLNEGTLEMRRRVLGPEHPDTLTAALNLAETLWAQGDLASARKLQEEALEARRRLLGPEHPHTLTAMGNLGLTLKRQGDLAGARVLEEKTLGGLRRLLGPGHADTLTAMGNLAATLLAQGDPAGARVLHEEELAACRRVLGPDHPGTLTARSNLASTLHDQGDLAAARKLKEETLEARRRVLGPDHPDTLAVMSNLATTLWAQGDLAAARELEEEALEARRGVLGPEHPDTTISAWNLSRTLEDLGQHAAASAVLDRDLKWLLDRDPAGLGAAQREIRGYVAKVVKRARESRGPGRGAGKE